MRRLLALAAGLVLAAGTAVAAAGPAGAATGDATVTVVHGVPLDAAAVVDVYANGSKLIDDLKYKDVKTLMVPAGSYDLAVVAGNAKDASSPILSAKGVAVKAGGNYSVVAHLTADGKPALTPFVNFTSPTDAGTARLTVRHTAAAPAVDVRANGKVIVAGLTNSGDRQESLMVPAGTYDVDVVLAGTDKVAIGPVNGLALKAGTTYVAYAVGNADAGYSILLQTYSTGSASGSSGMPTSVPAGEGTGSGSTLPLAAAFGLAGVALAAGSVRLARVRGRR